MSAIASFILLPKSVLDGLRLAAVPKKRWFGGAKDEFHDFLLEHGRGVVDYHWSGWVMAVVLPYLEERRQIDLSQSAHGDLVSYLMEKRGSSWVVLTSEHKRAFLGNFTPQDFSEADARDFYNAFNETAEAEIGPAMLDGVRAIHESLRAVDDDHIVLLNIG